MSDHDSLRYYARPYGHTDAELNAAVAQARAEEREACAQLAEQHRATYYLHGITPTGQPGIRHSFAALIRARSQP